MRVETTPSPAEGALRSLIEAQRASGDVEGATMSLRRLRRIAQLKPNEHRRLFLELRRRGRPGLLARYISKIARASPTPAATPA